jgi:curved DNA-binding protein CbpA
VPLLPRGAEAGPADVPAGAAAVVVGVDVLGAAVVGGSGVELVVAVGNGEVTVGSVSGKVTVGSVSGDVTVVISGRGVVSATAVAAAKPQTASTTRALTLLTSEQLCQGRIGCGRPLRKNGQGVAAVKRDYYEVLGVSRDADDEAIRRAFHDLARGWHPDVTHAPEAEERFRELAEAYSVLSKREARHLYDEYGYRGRGNDGFEEALWEARPPEVVRGENVQTDLELRSFEAAEGTRRIVSFQAIVRCTACMGRGSIGLPDTECRFCNGTGKKRSALHTYFSEVPEFEPCPECVGEPCPRCEGSGTLVGERKIRLRIPAGSIPGDLLVRVHVLPPPGDPRIVRYTAFVLLLVALATLVVYVAH